MQPGQAILHHRLPPRGIVCRTPSRIRGGQACESGKQARRLVLALADKSYELCFSNRTWGQLRSRNLESRRLAWWLVCGQDHVEQCRNAQCLNTYFFRQFMVAFCQVFQHGYQTCYLVSERALPAVCTLSPCGIQSSALEASD